MFLLTGKIGKAHKVRSSPCFYDRQNPSHFLAWLDAKTLAYLVFPFVVDWFNSEDSPRVTHEGWRAVRRTQEDEGPGQTAREGSQTSGETQEPPLPCKWFSLFCSVQ